MKKNISILFFFSTSLLSFGQAKKAIIDTVPVDSAIYTYTFDSNFVKYIDKNALGVFVSTIVDSINNLASLGQVPSFLKNPDFDYYHNNGLWSSPTKPIPFRFLIINKVTNCKSLRLILKDKSMRYKRKPSIRSAGIKYANLSMYELVKRRYKALKCGNH